jgi:hypothetical protein
MTDLKVLELYNEALENRNSLMFAMGKGSAFQRRYAQAQSRLTRLVRVMFSRGMFGTNAIPTTFKCYCGNCGESYKLAKGEKLTCDCGGNVSAASPLG